MNKRKLSRIFVFFSYMLGAFGVPVYLSIIYGIWLLETYDKLIYNINMIPLGLLLGLWFWISIGIFGYAVEEE